MQHPLSAVRILADATAQRSALPAMALAIERGLGLPVAVELVEGAPRNTALDSLLSLERLVLRRNRPCWSDPLLLPDALRVSGRPAASELAIDLTSAGIARTGETLRVLFNGHGGEDALAGALLLSGTPRIEILQSSGTNEPSLVAAGRASLEAASGIGGGMEAVWSRVVSLLVKAASSTADQPIPEDPRHLAPPAITRAASIKYGAKMIASAAARAAYRLCCRSPYWRIGWRFVEDGQDVWTRRDLGGVRWNVLPDPIDHFYADPFPLVRDGRHWLFFEDLDYATDKGVISVVEFDLNGPTGPARPVLEEPWHLSYPFLIEEDGQLWMIPEASLSGEITLYRSAGFPHRWERHATLVSGVEAADATIVRHGGRLYLFAVVRDGIGGYSDTLAIWHADRITGPWLPHARNPVLVDDRTARPAGNFVQIDGVLWRPVQDCRAAYGAALGLARIDRLDAGHFDQTVVTTLAPGADWPGRRLHSLNRAGRLEVVDGAIIRPRLEPLARMVERRFRP